mmetsp:Transcript_3876/g.17860  ORF Transcript_3876/g.17860 Transcript_3876/m.17860 type:complete len:323 (-) Transcript_3876:74-1042(-)
MHALPPAYTQNLVGTERSACIAAPAALSPSGGAEDAAVVIAPGSTAARESFSGCSPDAPGCSCPSGGSPSVAFALPVAMRFTATARGSAHPATSAHVQNTALAPSPPSPPPSRYTMGNKPKAATDPSLRTPLMNPLTVPHRPGNNCGMNPSGVISTASYTAPAMPLPARSVGKDPRSAPTAATKLPSAETMHTPTKTTTDGTPPWLLGTALSRPSKRGTIDDGRKYIAVIVEYRSGVTSSFGSTRSCSSTTPGASLLKWLHAMTIASSIEHATPLRRCGGIGVGRMVRPDRPLPAPRGCVDGKSAMMINASRFSYGLCSSGH